MHDMRLHIFGTSNRWASSSQELRDKLCQFWHSRWSVVRKDLDLPESIDVDEFNNWDIHHCITDANNERVLACSFHRFFNLLEPNVLSNPYLQNYESRFLNEMKERDFKSVMSFESLTTVGGFVGAKLAWIMAILGTTHFLKCGCDGLVAAARFDIGVADICVQLGCERVVSGTRFRGYPCDQLLLESSAVRPASREKLNLIAKDLWSRRLVHGNLSAWRVCFAA